MEKKELEKLAAFDPVVSGDAMTGDAALSKVAMILAAPEDPKHVSDLTEQEITHVAALKAAAKEMKDQVTIDFCDEFMSARINKDRKGRKELLEITKNIQEREARKWYDPRRLMMR